MSVLRGRSLSERCTSPNEHAELIRELEARYAEMLKPIRDLNKNFAVSLDVLEKYIHEVKQISIETINFANAGLILQSSKEVYARKVDYLEKLFEDLQRTAYNVKDAKHDDDSEKPDEAAKSKRAKKRKALAEGLEEYKLISPDDIPQLTDCSQMNFNNVGLTYITQLRACLLKPEVSVHVELRDVNGDLIGRKNDFRVNWPINQEGMPCDLMLAYYEERQRRIPDAGQPDRMLPDDLDGNDFAGGTDSLPPSPPVTPLSTALLQNGLATSTPSAPRCLTEVDTNGDLLSADGQSMLEDCTVAEKGLRVRTRMKRLPAKMTLGEFLHGKQRRSSKKKNTESRPRQKDKKAKEKEKPSGEEMFEDSVLENEVKMESCGGPDVGNGRLESPALMPTIPAGFSPVEEKLVNVKGLAKHLSPQNGMDTLTDFPEMKLDALKNVQALISSPDAYRANDGEELRDPPSPSESLVASAIGAVECPPDDNGCDSDSDLDVPRRDDVMDACRPSSTNIEETANSEGHPVDNINSGLELDPMNQRIRAWEDRIVPILEEMNARPKFRLPDYANRLLSKMRLGEVVQCSNLVASTTKYEVPRNFVALLHLCNTRNVYMENGNISLLSTEYRLSAEDIESYQ